MFTVKINCVYCMAFVLMHSLTKEPNYTACMYNIVFITMSSIVLNIYSYISLEEICQQVSEYNTNELPAYQTSIPYQHTSSQYNCVSLTEYKEVSENI